MGRKTKVIDLQRKGWRTTKQESYLAKKLIKLKDLCLKKQKRAERERANEASTSANEASSSKTKLDQVKGFCRNMVNCCGGCSNWSWGRETWQTPVEKINIVPEKFTKRSALRNNGKSGSSGLPQPSTRKNKTVSFARDATLRYFSPTPSDTCDSDSRESWLKELAEHLKNNSHLWTYQEETEEQRKKREELMRLKALCYHPRVKKISQFWVPLSVREENQWSVCVYLPNLQEYAEDRVARIRKKAERKRARIARLRRNIARTFWVPLDVWEEHVDTISPVWPDLQKCAAARLADIPRQKALRKVKSKRDNGREIRIECECILNEMIYEIESEEYGFNGYITEEIVKEIDAKRDELLGLAGSSIRYVKIGD
ncbi:uncharacterized protein LOC120345875 isoform X2 [Styela clava]